MIPNGWFAVASFLLLLAPGILFDLLAGRRRVQVSETTLREAGRIILASICFSSLGVACAVAVANFFPGVFMPPDMLALSDRPQLRDALGSVVATVALVFVVSMSSAWVFEHLRRGQQRPSLSTQSGWHLALRDVGATTEPPFVRVRLLSGSTYWGRVASYTADIEIADRELVLSPPMYAKPPGEKPGRPMPSAWQRLVIHGSQVTTIAVAYLPEVSLLPDLRPAQTPREQMREQDAPGEQP